MSFVPPPAFLQQIDNAKSLYRVAFAALCVFAASTAVSATVAHLNSPDAALYASAIVYEANAHSFVIAPPQAPVLRYVAWNTWVFANFASTIAAILFCLRSHKEAREAVLNLNDSAYQNDYGCGNVGGSAFASPTFNFVDSSAASAAALGVYTALGGVDVFAAFFAAVVSGIGQLMLRFSARFGTWSSGAVNFLAALATLEPVVLVISPPDAQARSACAAFYALYVALCVMGRAWSVHDDVAYAASTLGRITACWQVWALYEKLSSDPERVQRAKDVFFMVSALPLTAIFLWHFVRGETAGAVDARTAYQHPKRIAYRSDSDPSAILRAVTATLPPQPHAKPVKNKTSNGRKSSGSGGYITFSV